MSKITHAINKGVNKPVEFRGLKAQYLVYLALVIVALLLGFAIMYMLGIPIVPCLVILAIAGGSGFYYVFRLSKKYGQYGMLKRRAAKKIPRTISIRSRIDFY